MRLETERLLLRPLEMQDAEDLVALHATPEVSRFMTVLDPEGALRRIKQDHRDWAERGYGMVAIVDRATGQFLGRTGLKGWPQFGEIEIGWALIPTTWGAGVATEAAFACVDWGFRNLDVPYLISMIRPDNERSIRVAQRLGFTPLRPDVLRGQDLIVHAVSREAWASSQR